MISRIISNLKVYGEKDAEIVKNILIAYLSEKGYKVEIEKDGDLKEVEANPSFLSGSYDLIRPQLHAILDECLDAYEYTKQPRKNRDEIKRVHPDDGKPFIWSPKSAK